MGVKKRTASNAIYLSIISGEFRQKSTEDNPDAVKREYEDKDGNPKVKYEIPYSSVDGILTGVKFRDSDFGEQAEITIEDAGEVIQISVGTDSRFFSDLAKKLPNIDLSKVVELTPYEMETDNGKTRRGITVRQDGEKIQSAYWDADKKKAKGGIPVATAEERAEFDGDDWKMHFIKEKKFLKKKVEKMTFGTAQPVSKATRPEPAASNEPDDLPF